MNHLSRIGIAATLAMATAGSFAQDSTQSVEVRAQAPVRTDVRALCPDVDSYLPDVLATVARERSEAALIDVRFALDGSSVGEVQTGAGPRAYQRAIRWAVRGLQCRSPDAGPQTVTLRIQFIDPFARPGQSAVALVSPDLPR